MGRPKVRRVWNTGRIEKAANGGVLALANSGPKGGIPRRFGLMEALNLATDRGVSPAGFEPMPRSPYDDGPFGPGQAIEPAPIDPLNPQTGRPEPRVWEYPQSWNLPGNNRREVPWQVLRAAASGVDIIRRCIEVRKAHVADLQWSWSVRASVVEDAYNADRAKGYEDIASHLREQHATEIKRLTARWERPWPHQDWTFVPWVKSVMEELLVIDASVIYPRLSLGGDVLDLEQVDGSCYSDDTEVLTGRGWLRFADVTAADLFATRNQKTKAFEWQSATYFHRAAFTGTMLNFRSKALDLLVSPNHRMVVASMPRGLGGSRHRERGEVIITAEELAQHGTANNTIPMTSTWDAPDLKSFTLPASGRTNSLPFNCTGDDFAAFMGMYLSEGSLAGPDQVLITQSPQSKGFAPFRGLLERIFGRDVCHTGQNFVIGRRCLHDYLKQFGHAHEKHAPNVVKNMSARQLGIFWRFYMLGDGHYATDGREIIVTSSERMAGDLQEVTQKMGRCANVSREEFTTDTVMRDGRIILAENKRPRYTVRLSRTTHRVWKLAEVPYDGDIFCVSVPNEVLYVRRNGKAAWCGNTIKPLLDYRGIRPEPPYPAYQQEIFGFPRGEWAASTTLDENGNAVVDNGFAASEMYYFRSNPRITSPYGLSAVEQALISARLYLKRQGWMLAEYDDGSTPLTVWELPEDPSQGMTVKQRREWEQSINAELAGQEAARHRMKVGVPGWKVHQLSSADERYKPDFDLFLVKLVAGHFGVTATELGFSETTGLGSAGWQEGQAEVGGRVGTRPDVKALTELINGVSRQFLNAPPELEFSFIDPASENDKDSDSVADSQLKRGTITLNDDRRRLKQPLFSFPEADMPMLVGVGTAGYVFLDGAKQAAVDAAAAAVKAQEATADGTTAKVELEGAKLEDQKEARHEEQDLQRENRDAEHEFAREQADTTKAAMAEVTAFRKWRKDKPHPKRPFVFKAATPDDWPELAEQGPEVADFGDDWEWISSGDIHKYESWWPRDSRGRWIKRSYAGARSLTEVLNQTHTPPQVLTDADLQSMGDDDLFDLFGRLSAQDQLDEPLMRRLIADMDRRERATPVAALANDDMTDDRRKVDDLVAGGRDYLSAYAEVHSRDERTLGDQAADSMVDRRTGETLHQAVRRSYDEWLHVNYLQAEKSTRGNLLNRAGKAAGVDPLHLFTGPVSRARKYASEELMRFWAQQDRLNFTQFRAQVLRRDTDVQAAERTRQLSNAKDFI